MAYLPGFEHDIFISYARLNEGADRWVSRFHERLEATLKQHTSKDLKIWRDTRWLDGGQLFDQTIETAIDGSGLLLALNSHAHRGSDYCLQEAQRFCDKTKKDGWGSSIGDRKRIVNAMLDNIPFKDWHPAFSGASGFYFHDKTISTGIAPSYRPGSTKFKNSVDELAISLALTLRAFKQEIDNRESEQLAADKTDGNGHTFSSSSVLLDTHMKDDDYAMEVRNALRSMNVKTYFNQSDDDPGESLENFGARLKKLRRIIIVFGNVRESWVLNRFGAASEIANGEKTELKVGVYYAPPRSKGNGGQLNIGSLTVYELDQTDLQNPEAWQPLLG